MKFLARYFLVGSLFFLFSCGGEGQPKESFLQAPVKTNNDGTLSDQNEGFTDEGYFVTGTEQLPIDSKVNGVEGSSNPMNSSRTSNFTLLSHDFIDGESLDLMNACALQGGADHNMQLSWANLDPNAVELAVVMDDETYPCGIGEKACPHWGVYSIPSSTLEIAHHSNTEYPMSQAHNGQNSYQGACPLNGEHTYKVTLYALSQSIDSNALTGSKITRASFTGRYASEILETATLTGTWSLHTPP